MKCNTFDRLRMITDSNDVIQMVVFVSINELDDKMETMRFQKKESKTEKGKAKERAEIEKLSTIIVKEMSRYWEKWRIEMNNKNDRS